MKPDHPKQALTFVVEGEVDDELASKLRTLIQELAVARQWTIGPPEFIDEVSGDQDDSARLVGGSLEIYSAWPPWNEDLPFEVDRDQFQECELLVRSLVEFSAAHDVEFGFTLDHVSVGWIDNGEMTQSLADGLLGEWRRALGL